ncbi:MAG: FAD-dependent oxidoreductase [Myxococcota bacterium]
MFNSSKDQLLPLPPSPAGGPKYHDFGEEILGKSRDALELFLKAEGTLRDPAEVSLAEQVRRFVYERDRRKRLVDAAASYLKRKGPSLRRDYDVVLVGAGIHAASFVYTVKKSHPSLSVLIVEKSSAICSTFFGLGDSLVLNSPTFSKVGLNSNIVPGHFVQLSDFDELAERPFPTAKHFYELATMVLFHADAEIAFDFAVDDVSPDHGRYRVSSADSTVRAKSVVIANGMGEPNAASFVRDGSSDRIVDGDDFIAAQHHDHDFLERIRNKRVAVVGAGDTANCVMECLLPLVYPHRRYGFPEEAPFLPRFIHWLGQPAKDVQDYYFANKHRYCHSGGVIEFFWNGEGPFDLSAEIWGSAKERIEFVPEKLVSLSDKGDLVELTTATTRFETDWVVDCTGRSNPLSAALLRDSYEFVEGPIVLYGGQWDEMLDHFVSAPRFLDARRLACKLKGERVFLLGSACPLDELIDDTEARNGSLRYQEDRSSLTNSKWSLEHTLPRTVAFAEKFVETVNGLDAP